MRVHAFTSFSFSYLNRARVLAASLKRVHPDWTLTAVITDRVPEGFAFDPAAEPFDRILLPEDLVGDLGPSWLFSHDIVEACTAVKGRAMTRLLAEDVGAVVYLDPDIAVFNRLDPVLEALQRASIVLTPHQTEPNTGERAILDNEVTSLRLGTYNLGFIAVRKDATGRAFANWWEERLLHGCVDEPERGIFVDQKWCDLIPSFFDDVAVLRDPGLNVASWNLSRRRLVFDAHGDARVNGALLRFYHFTKLGPIGDAMTRRYAGGNVEVFELWAWYRAKIEAATEPAIPKGYWAFGTYDDGSPIAKRDRVLYRRRGDLRTAFANPFAVGPGTFRTWLDRNAAEEAA